MVSTKKYTVFDKRPNTKVVIRLPIICDDVIKLQNKPNISVFRYYPATSLM